jgi:hypothetical protein
MHATLLHRGRLDFDDGAVVQMVVLRVPQPIEGCRHPYKYRLFYRACGKRVVGYDNERGKNDDRLKKCASRFIFLCR